jgi:hormone-sensitive lipase
MLSLIDDIKKKPWYHHLAELFFHVNAMKAFEDGIFQVFKSDNEDIFYLEPGDENRLNFLKNVYKISPRNPDDLSRRVEILYQGISLWIAIGFQNKDKEGVFDKIKDLMFSSPLYLLSKKHRVTKFREFVAAHDYELVCKMVKSINGMIPNKLMSVMCPGIHYHKVIYIPRIKKTLTIKGLKQTMDDFMKGKRRNSRFEETYCEVEPIYSSQKMTKTIKRCKSMLYSNEKLKSEFINEFGYKEQTERLLKLRIVSPVDLEIIDEMEKLRFQPIRKIHKVKAIIIHIHGGGFVTMSSDQHQTYTRQWARDVGIPIFMISYRLSPEWRYPDALDDCWQSYNWILEYWKDALGIEPEKIFLSGDSAGGNLAVSLTALCICKGIKTPDALFTFYPALMTWMRGFIPSRILSFDDHILNYTMLTFCLNAYWKDINSEEHEFMSPMLFPDKLLKRFPTFKCFLAGSDPLRDDGYKFAYKLFKLGREVAIAEYKKLPHGFLSFDIFPFLAEESSKAIKHSSMWFKLEMTKQLNNDECFHISSEKNHVLYKSSKLHDEEQILAYVDSEVPAWKRALNKVSLPFLKLFF